MADVLVVDDDETVREVVVSYLRAGGHDVTEAGDGEAALTAMRRRRADIVVLDLMLPGIGGIEVCRRLRDLTEVPIIMLTALGAENDRLAGLRMGADDYVTKPFSPRELVLRVDSVLRRAGQRSARGVRVVDGDLVVEPREHTATLARCPADPDRARVRPAPLPRGQPEDGLVEGGAAARRVGLVLRRPVHRDRARAPAAREGRGRPHPSPAARHGLGRRLPVGAVVTSDDVHVVLIAAGWSLAVGVLGILAGYLVRRAPIRWPAGLIALVAIGGVVAGVVGTARAMFLSTHDLGVVVWVCVVSGLVSGAFALLLARTLAVSARRLRSMAAAVGAGEVVDPAGNDPRELRAVARELARSSERLRSSRERERRLEQSRRELVAWVSHDLRTPLAGLRAMAESLDDGHGGRPRPLPPADAPGGRPDGPDGRRPVRAVQDPRRVAQPHAAAHRPARRGQ